MWWCPTFCGRALVPGDASLLVFTLRRCSLPSIRGRTPFWGSLARGERNKLTHSLCVDDDKRSISPYTLTEARGRCGNYKEARWVQRSKLKKSETEAEIIFWPSSFCPNPAQACVPGGIQHRCMGCKAIDTYPVASFAVGPKPESILEEQGRLSFAGYTCIVH